jgi:hypothetical protein
MEELVAFGACLHFTAGEHDAHGFNTFAKAAFNMMIFAMNVAGNGSADRDQFGARGYFEKPPFGKKCRDDLRQKDSGLAYEHSGIVVKGEHPITGTHGKKSGRKGTVSVAAAITKGNERIGLSN